jgi:hypothetical protein
MDIDLNLNNYSVEDLKKLFGITSTCTILEVEQQKQLLLDRLNQFNVNQQTQNEILLFLNSAKDELLKQLDIIPKPITPFVYSNPSNYFQGTINPLEKRLVTKTVCIDTLFRSNYTATKSTDYTYTFPESINNVVSLKIKAIEVPSAWYNISEKLQNNNFLITIQGNSTPILIGIPDGFYIINPLSTSNDALIKIINDQLTDQGINLQCQLYQASNRLQFYWTDNSTTKFTVDFTNLGKKRSCTSTDGLSLGWILGFKQDIYTDDYSYTAESTFCTSINNYFFVDVDDFHSNHSTDSVVSIVRTPNGLPSYLGNNIMARVPSFNYVNSVSIGLSSEFYVLNKREYFGPVRLERMNIRLLDRFGKVIDLINNDYSIVFEIIQLYS